MKGVDEKGKLLYRQDKQYLAGQTYNGVALTVTGTNTTVISRATFIPFKTSDGAMFIRGKIVGTTAGGTSMIDITVPGASFMLLSTNCYQSGYCGFITDVGIAQRTPLYTATGIKAGVPTLDKTNIALVGSGNFSAFSIGFEFEVDAWPTWADAE